MGRCVANYGINNEANHLLAHHIHSRQYGTHKHTIYDVKYCVWELDRSVTDILLNVFLAIAVDNLADAQSLSELDKDAAAAAADDKLEAAADDREVSESTTRANETRVSKTEKKTNESNDLSRCCTH